MLCLKYHKVDIYYNLRAHSNIYDNFEPFSAIQNINIFEYCNRTIQKRNTENTHKGEPVTNTTLLMC